MKLNRLKEVFKEYNVKNRIIAKYLGKTPETISKWVNNKRQPSIEELDAIARLLRIDISLLLNQTTWENECSETYEEIKLKYDNTETD